MLYSTIIQDVHIQLRFIPIYRNSVFVSPLEELQCLCSENIAKIYCFYKVKQESVSLLLSDVEETSDNPNS